MSIREYETVALAALNRVPPRHASSSVSVETEDLHRISIESDDSARDQLSVRGKRSAWQSRFARIGAIIPNALASVRKWKYESRFHGWQWGVLTGLCTAIIVLLINIIFAILCVSRGLESGLVTLYVGKSSDVDFWNSTIHVIINVLSTLLLSASNYAMQVLCAPTRRQCEIAHARREWLDIGVFSVRNVFAISRNKKLLWAALCLSSIPLHLFYNASVFKVITGNDYTITIEYYNVTSPEYVSNGNDQSLTWLTPERIKTAYGETEMSEFGDISLLFEEVSMSYLPEDYRAIMNRSTFAPSFETPVTLRTSSAGKWVMLMDKNGWIYAGELDPEWASSLDSPDMGGQLRIKFDGGFARVGPRNSKIQTSLVFALIVIVSNVMKVACLVAILKLHIEEADAPMVTVGDAIASFMTRPDTSSVGCCTWSKMEFLWYTGKVKRTAKVEEDGGAEKLEKRLRGVWERRRVRFGYALSQPKQMLLGFGGLIIPLWGFTALSMGVDPISPWGTNSQGLLSFGQQRFDGNASALKAFVANSPQLLISVVYLLFNHVFTSMAMAHEWNQFGMQRKGLRVSKPSGEQRESYFLQLPLKWGVPLNSVSGLLHWLISQTLFVVRLDHRNRDGSLKGDSVAAVGFSSSALLAVIVVIIALSWLAAIIGLLKFEARVPLAGTNSWVISAACHTASDMTDAALKKVKWGVVREGTSDQDVGHCSFSNELVKKPKVGNKYA